MADALLVAPFPPPIVDPPIAGPAANLPLAQMDDERVRLEDMIQKARADASEELVHTEIESLVIRMYEMRERQRQRPREFEEMLSIIERRRDNMEREIEQRVEARRRDMEREMEAQREIEHGINVRRIEETLQHLRRAQAEREVAEMRHMDLQERLMRDQQRVADSQRAMMQMRAQLEAETHLRAAAEAELERYRQGARLALQPVDGVAQPPPPEQGPLRLEDQEGADRRGRENEELRQRLDMQREAIEARVRRIQQRRQEAIDAEEGELRPNRLRAHRAQIMQAMVGMMQVMQGGEEERERARLRKEEERAVVEAKRAAWQAERDDNEQPDNLALRYARRCASCFCENPLKRAVFTTCGHASMCMPCAEESTEGKEDAKLDCVLCRTHTGFVRLWEDLAHEMAPQGNSAPTEEEPETSLKRKSDDDDQRPAPRRSKRLTVAQRL